MTIRIVCTIDNNYTQHCGVMISSIVGNSQRKDFFFYIIHNNLEPKKMRTLELFLKKLELAFHFIEIDSSKLEGAFISDHVTIATYFRIFIPQLIDSSVEKILFLDSDIIVRHDISQLWSTDISDYTHAAVENPCISDSFKNNLGVYENTSYFNAGVMLMNLKQWRDLDITNQAIQFIHDYPQRIIFWDQDVLNFLLQGKWFKLAPYWNAQEAFFRDYTIIELQITQEDFQKTRFDPALIHYTGSGSCKPWHYYCNHPFKQEYYKYVEPTPWKFFRPTAKPSLMRRLFRKLKSSVKKVLNRKN